MGSSRLPRQSAQLLRELPPQHAKRMARQTPLPFTDELAGIAKAWANAPRLADVLDAQHNNFSVLRLLMALAVLISHTMFLASGSFMAEPLVGSTGYSLGQYGVQGFFILSGILVTQSLVKRGDLVDYGRARAFRIFPALIVCVALTVLVIGPALSIFGAASYFKSFGVIEYVGRTLTLSTGSAGLPGLCVGNPASAVVNQSLWTLKYEVACYLLLGGLAALIWRAPYQRTATMIALAGWAALMLLARPTLTHAGNFLETLTYFALFFGTGVAAFLLRDTLRIVWYPLVPLALFFVTSFGTELAEISAALFFGYAILWLATLSFFWLRTYCNSNDYSYGTYIYGYPVTQAILTLWPGINIVSLLLMTLGCTLALAFLSWELVERPALAWVHRRRTKSSAPLRLSLDTQVIRRATIAT